MRLGFGWRAEKHYECVDCHTDDGWLLTRGAEWERWEWRLRWLRRLHPVRARRWDRWGKALGAAVRIPYSPYVSCWQRFLYQSWEDMVFAPPIFGEGVTMTFDKTGEDTE